jgi:hypothetical protein
VRRTRPAVARLESFFFSSFLLVVFPPGLTRVRPKRRVIAITTVKVTPSCLLIAKLFSDPALHGSRIFRTALRGRLLVSCSRDKTNCLHDVILIAEMWYVIKLMSLAFK